MSTTIEIDELELIPVLPEEPDIWELSALTKNLIAARELIRDPKNWCKGAYKKGNRYCSMGAVHAVTPRSPNGDNDNQQYAMYLMLRAASMAQRDICPYTLNDRRSHAEVMQMWDSAILASTLNI